MRQVVVYPGDDGYWVAECPSLAGCISQGKSRQDAIVNIKEAIEGYIAVMILRREKPFSQVVVPDHKELDRGTLRAIIRQAGLGLEEFKKWL